MKTINQFPFYARLALERLICDEALRSNIKLDELLDAYASTYGEECDSITRDSAHKFACARFNGAFSILG